MHWWQIARAQGGVISHAQLGHGGRSASTVTRMTASGELTRLTRAVYLVGGAPLTWHARLWAAVLATDGVLGYQTAGRLWGVYDEPEDRVHVVVPADRHIAEPSGVRLHRTGITPAQTRERSGLPVCPRPRTILDLLGTLPYERAARLADRAMQRRWLTPRDCERRVADSPGRAGNPQLRRLTAQLADGAAAESERVLHRLLRAANVRGWVANYDVWAGGELLAVIDVALPHLRLAIEVDGMAYHVDVDRFRRDRTRQNTLVGRGWTVLRFTWADLTERPGYVIGTIARMAGARAVG